MTLVSRLVAVLTGPSRRRRAQKALILRVLSVPGLRLTGLALCREAGIKSGAHHPILAELERDGLVVSEWGPVEPGRAARRRYYRLAPLVPRDDHER
jgi:DNA-binding PadR family transcriptional regulator